MINIAFVTGSTGKIGSELVSHLIENNILVVGVGKFSEASTISLKLFENKDKELNINHSLVLDKWTDYEEDDVSNLIKKENNYKSYFFHLAWSGENRLTDGGYKKQIDNVGLSAKYLDLSKKLNVDKFINSGSFDEIYIKRCIDYGDLKKMKNYQHLEYGIAKLATRDILSFKSYVEKIDFVHTRTSIAIDNNLKNDNFIEKNLRNILKGKKYASPKNKELCNMSTCKNIAEKIYKIALIGKNQKNYFTGTNTSLTIENYFKLIEKLVNGEELNFDNQKILRSQIFNPSDFKNKESGIDDESSNFIEDLNNLFNSLDIK